MKQKTLVCLSVAATLGFLTPLTSSAFGLGQITLHSALNEPFKAEIEVNALREDERDNLQVRLASNQDFERAGLERNYLLTQLRFEVIDEGAVTRVLISSDIPIKEPFLGFLLSATTGQGRLLREYTVLLDPPKALYGSSNTSSSALASQQRIETPRSTSGYSSQQTDYKVRSRDTLWSIAERTRPSADVSMQQMMLALLEENPAAFQQKNVNGLQAGHILKIPAMTVINRISTVEAKAVVNQQNAAWQTAGQTENAADTAVIVAAQVSQPVADPPQATDDEIQNTAAAEAEQSSPVTDDAEPSDYTLSEEARLELVTASDNPLFEADPAITGDIDLQRLSQQLTLTQETIEAQSQENVDFRTRMDAMERQLNTMRRLIALKDADMARLQNLLEQNDAQTDLARLVDEVNAILDGNSHATASSTDETMPVAFTEDIATLAATEWVAEDEITESPNAATQIVAEDHANNLADEKAAAVAAYFSQVEESSFAVIEPTEEAAQAEAELELEVAEVANELDIDEQQYQALYHRVQAFVTTYMIESLLGALLLLLILWILIRRSQREVSWDEAVNNAQKDKKTQPVIDPDATKPESEEAADIEVVSEDHAVAQVLERADSRTDGIDTEQAEPEQAAEHADKQMADDKDDIAAELLFAGEALPEDEQISALVDSTAIEQQQVFEQQEETATEETADAVENDAGADHIEFNLDDYKTELAEQSAAVDTYQHDEQDLLPFNINYDESSFAEQEMSEIGDAIDEQSEADDSLRIHLDVDNLVVADSGQPELLDVDLSEAESSLAQDMDEPALPDALTLLEDGAEPELLSAADAVLETEAILDHGIDDMELDFDLGDFDSIDEAETKLDLAVAYSDMGDPDGARGILEEVLEQGDFEQKKRAQQLLDALSH